MTAWFESPAARRLGVRFPIVQGRSGAYRPRSSWQRSRTSADSARTENQLHEGILEACTTDECREAENARYAEVSARIIAGRKECFAGCHHQGGGSGGR